MRILLVDRYVVRQILPPFFLGVGAFVVILVGDILYTLAEFLATKRVGFEVLLRLLAYKLPAIAVVTFPVATLIGTLLGLGRLANDRELQAMRLLGMSLLRVFTPVLVFGLFISCLTFMTNEYVAPWANHQGNDLLRRAAFGERFPAIREQVFFRGPGNRFYYIGAADDSRRVLRDVMIYEAASPLPKLITARYARWDLKVWNLADGVMREFDDEGFTRYEAKFAEMKILVGIDGGTFLAGQKTPEEMTAGELRQYLRLFGSNDAGARFAVEYYRKFAIPVASAIFALVAAPLSVRAAGGRFPGVGVSIALLFAYYVIMSVGKALGATGVLAPALAAWLPNLAFGLMGLLMWMREDDSSRFRRLLSATVRINATP